MAEPAAPMATQAAPPAQPWLDGPLADGVSVVAFQAAAIFVGEVLLFLVSPVARLLVGAGVGSLGALGCAIERGEARRLSWGQSALIGALAALTHGASLLLLEASGLPGQWGTEPALLAGRLGLLFVLSIALAQLGRRFDRQEAGWREACREGPATGASPLADRIAQTRLPTPLRLLLLLALPLTLALRALCLLAILAYQLTASRLMPPACRYEPSCSRYGFDAYLKHGVARGSLLTLLRLIRCSPIGPGGYDPVPKGAEDSAHRH